jgi:hypothetical protein
VFQEGALFIIIIKAQPLETARKLNIKGRMGGVTYVIQSNEKLN